MTEPGEPHDPDELDEGEGESLRGALAALKTPTPPSQDFSKAVEDRIHRRSGGRFFGPKGLGGRSLAIVAIMIIALSITIYWLMRSSETGSLRLQDKGGAPEMAPGAKDVLPKP